MVVDISRPKLVTRVEAGQAANLGRESMATFHFLHAADLHLDSPLRGLARRGAQAGAFVEASRRALENLVAEAIGQEVAFVVIAGDIYDGDWRDYATGHFFVREMGRLARAGIRVFVLRGNHDAESVVTRSLILPPNVHSFSVRHVETVRIDEFRVALHGRGFAHRHVEENVALAYPPAIPGWFNIGVLHTSLTGREGHDVYAPCSVEDLQRAGYDYWALGHVHQREVVAENPAIVFPGNLQGRHAHETGPKGATLVRVFDGRIAGIESLALDAARFEHVEIDLSGASDLPGMARMARRRIGAARNDALGRPLAVRLTFTGETPLHDHLCAHPDQVEEDMQALAWEAGADVLIEKVRNATAAPAKPSAAMGFDEILAAVAVDPVFRADVAGTLADLRSKAPVEALKLLDSDAQDPATVADAAIRSAEETILAALNGAAGAEPAP